MAESDNEQGAFAWGTGAAAGTAAAGRQVAPAPVRPRVREAGPGAGVRGRARSSVATTDMARRQLRADESLPPDNELWDVRAAARFLKRSVSWVYHKAEDGTLPAKRLGGWGVRFVAAELRAWVERQDARSRGGR